MEHVDEYNEAALATMDLIWGEGFMAPGGEGNVDNLVSGLNIRGKRILDIGCGQGRAACLLAEKYGATVVGTDLEAHLIARSQKRAEKLNLQDKTQFITVKTGPLLFEDSSFDVIISSGAFTQIEDKLSMYKECLRVLKSGGTLSCYDWMKTPGEFSQDMLYWFKVEGLTYAMKTPEEHQALLLEAGFSQATCIDKSAWYKQKAREEYNQIKTQLYPQAEALLGKAEADHFVEDWRALMVVCEKNEMLQVYTRATKA